MPTAEQIAAVYDFKNIFGRALAAVLTDNGVTAFTTQAVPSTGDATQDAALVAAGFQILNFQKDRPRAEIDFTPGAGQGRFIPVRVDGTKIGVETARAGTYRVLVVTKPDIREHNAFVCMIHWLMDTMGGRINGTAPMTRHAIAEQFRDGGSSPTTKAEDGNFQTLLQYNINFSVQANAWADLES